MENNTTTTETGTVHIFERAGLGKAPFKYVGQISQDIAYGEAVISRESGILVTTKPGGTCDFCGAYILNMFQIESADGRTFKVGSDCVMKTGDAGLRKVVAAEVAKATRERTVKRNAEKIAALKAQLADTAVRAKLAAQPHPLAFRAKLGETLTNWVEWMMRNSGTSGKLRVAKVVKDALASCVGACSCEAESPCPRRLAAWKADERHEQECDNIAAARFEDRAYGRN